MKEYFTIKTGLPFYDADVDELNIYYHRQQVAYGLMLVGGILVIWALL